jgi:hypothetical protein
MYNNCIFILLELQRGENNDCIGDYKLIKLLARGGFGKVELAKRNWQVVPALTKRSLL